jgi:hypothetical protein
MPTLPRQFHNLLFSIMLATSISLVLYNSSLFTDDNSYYADNELSVIFKPDVSRDEINLINAQLETVIVSKDDANMDAFVLKIISDRPANHLIDTYNQLSQVESAHPIPKVKLN